MACAPLAGMTPPGLVERRTAAARVLVIEDEERARISTAALLRLAGHRAEVVADGREALALLLQRRDDGSLPDILLLDLQMPYLTGLDLLDRLDAAGIAVPAIAVTGFGDRQTVVELLRRGCCDLLDKPIDPDELLARIAQVLARGRHPVEPDGGAATERASAGAIAVEVRRLGRDGGSGGDWCGVSGDRRHAELMVIDAAATDPRVRSLLEQAVFGEGHRGCGGEALVRRLNRALLCQGGDLAGLAVAILLVDLEAMTLDVVSVGHLPVLFQPRGEPQTRMILAGAASLGRGDRLGFERRRLSIHPGDRVMACTDGVVRAAAAAPGRARFGAEALASAFASRCDRPLGEALAAAWSDLETFCGGRADDDRLLLAFAVPHAEPAPGTCP